ncbi:hypothetical protein [uncultured Microbacterium sp.]|uniref:hypothetical protein n=1 Tax=uncultured Microbacterium sp. TaxID=191216 RepID=UPI0028E70339|nr:hypothetical protein [uncultured Microbacterium sp.]
MAQIDVKPIVLRDVLLSIAADSYEKHVSGVTITPTTGSVTWNGLTPDAAFNFPTSTTWALQLDYAQDWDTANSLSRYLFDHEGQEVTMIFEPVKGGLGWEVDVVIVPGSIGGQVNAVATATVTLGVNGKPRPVAA